MIGSKISESTNAYVSTKNLIPDVKIISDTKLSKFECFLPCTFDQALLSYHDNEQLYKSDPNCGKFETTEYWNYEELQEIYKKNGTASENTYYKRENSVNRLEMKLPAPFNPRVANFAVTCYYDAKNQRFLRIGKNFMPEGSTWCTPSVQEVTLKRGQKPKKKKCYSFFLFSASMYTKIDESRVYYQEVNINELAGWASSKAMFKAIAKDRKEKFRSQMLKLAMEFPVELKTENEKERLYALVDGKMNGFGNLLYNTIQLEKLEEKSNKKEGDEKKEEIKEVKKEEIEIIKEEEKKEVKEEAMKEEVVEETKVKEEVVEEEIKEEIKEEENVQEEEIKQVEIQQEIKDEAKDESTEETKEENEIKPTETNEDVKESVDNVPIDQKEE